MFKNNRSGDQKQVSCHLGLDEDRIPRYLMKDLETRYVCENHTPQTLTLMHF